MKKQIKFSLLIILSLANVRINCETAQEAKTPEVMDCDITKTPSYIQQGFFKACYNFNAAEAQKFLDQGADINAYVDGTSKQTILSSILSQQIIDNQKDAEIVKFLVNAQNKKLNVNNLDKSGSSALMYLTIYTPIEKSKGNIKAACNCIDYLLSRKDLQINVQNSPNGFTALSCAAGFGFLYAVKELLKNGADKTKKDSYGRNALAYAKRGIENNDDAKVKAIYQEIISLLEKA